MKNLRLLQLAAISLFAALVISCSEHSGSTHKNKHTVLKFTRHKLIDKQGTGYVAATYLVPEGWKVQDKIEWNINSVAQPATITLLIYDEETNSSMQGFPNKVFLVNTDKEMNEEYPAGSNYLGAEVINQKPGVLDLIKNYILPEFENNEGFKIIESKNLSLAKSNHKRAVEFKNTDSKSGRVKIEYTENGKVFEESIYATITFVPVSKYQQYAYLSMCYGCKAIKGDLENTMDIFETILNSVKLNPKWAVTYNQVMQMAMRDAMESRGYSGDNNNYYNGYWENDEGSNYNNSSDGNYEGGTTGGNYDGTNYSTGNTGSLSNYLQQANGYVNDAMIQNYENQQRSNDRMSEARSDYMLDYQNYTDPNTGEVLKLSSGYSNAWTDNSGNVIMSNEAGYDPNVGGGSSSWSSLDVGGSTVAAPEAPVATTPDPD